MVYGIKSKEQLNKIESSINRGECIVIRDSDIRNRLNPRHKVKFMGATNEPFEFISLEHYVVYRQELKMYGTGGLGYKLIKCTTKKELKEIENKLKDINCRVLRNVSGDTMYDGLMSMAYSNSEFKKRLWHLRGKIIVYESNDLRYGCRIDRDSDGVVSIKGMNIIGSVMMHVVHDICG